MLIGYNGLSRFGGRSCSIMIILDLVFYDAKIIISSGTCKKKCIFFMILKKRALFYFGSQVFAIFEP